MTEPTTEPVTEPVTDPASIAAAAPAIEGLDRAAAVSRLVEAFDLEQVDTDLFRGRPTPNERGRAFGGLVAAQAVQAAALAVEEDFTIHSMHSYFLLPGDPLRPIVYDVERIRDGRSFLTRRVAARQNGRPIYYLTANFHRHEEGYEHQDLMPEVKPPDEAIDMLALMAGGGFAEGAALAREWAAVDVRVIGSSRLGLDPDPRYPSQQRVWMRFADRLPDDPHVHRAAFTWASDISLLGASLGAHVVSSAGVQMASLDHSIWFHRPFRADEWWLYDQVSPSAQGGRGLSIGRVFAQDGTLVATVAQEGIIRPPRPKG